MRVLTRPFRIVKFCYKIRARTKQKSNDRPRVSLCPSRDAARSRDVFAIAN